MRIALLTESFLPRTDGVVRTVLELLHHLRTHGHEALVFAAGRGVEEYEGYRIVRVGGPRFPLYPALTLAPYSPSMPRLLRAFAPDVIHLASPFVLGAQGQRVGARLGVPVAAHYQTDVAAYAAYYGFRPLMGLARGRLRRLHNRCRVTYAPTASIRRELEEEGFRAVRVLGRGVDTVLFDPAKRSHELRGRLLQPGERTLLLYVGRLSTEKNLEALKPLVEHMQAARLVLVGEGPHRAALGHLFRGLPVTFVGLQRGEDLAAYYASADLFAFPSQTETFGQVVQEAMASGLPVLAFRAGGVQDLFRDGEEGFLCPPGDTLRWIEAANRLAADPAVCAAFGQRARASAGQRTWGAIFDQLLREYGELARERHVGSGAPTLESASRVQ